MDKTYNRNGGLKITEKFGLNNTNVLLDTYTVQIQAQNDSLTVKKGSAGQRTC